MNFKMIYIKKTLIFIKEEVKDHNPNRLTIAIHPNTIVPLGGSRFRKTKALPRLINHQRNIDKMYFYFKDQHEPKYQLLIKKHEKVGKEYLKDPKPAIEYLNCVKDSYRNTDKYNPGKKHID